MQICESTYNSEKTIILGFAIAKNRTKLKRKAFQLESFYGKLDLTFCPKREAIFSTEFRYHFIKSLILAQDERWRRA